MRPQDFYVRTRASRGVRVELVDPAGKREWVRVRSVLSDEFQAAVTESWNQLFADVVAAGDCVQEQKRLRRLRHARQAASLIAEWSLPPSVDPVGLMVQNPRLRRQIERIAQSNQIQFGAAA